MSGNWDRTLGSDPDHPSRLISFRSPVQRSVPRSALIRFCPASTPGDAESDSVTLRSLFAFFPPIALSRTLPGENPVKCYRSNRRLHEGMQPASVLA